MKYYFALLVLLGLMSNGFALDGQIGIHDPSTIILCDGKYYTYGTGGSPLVSDDGWTWRRGVVPARTGAAPDVIHIGDRYYMYISGVTMISSKSLDPNSPDYKWEDGGTIVGKESPDDFMNPIDPGAFLDPNTGRLWLTYGSYFGYIRVAELDPKTGKRLHPDKQPPNIGINLEATTMIYHDGWYYLLGTHGSCCRGADSGYNIRVGRSKDVTGPFLDDDGVDMLEGGGKLLITSGGRVVGPGHFGLLDLGDGVQKFSMHWEADLDRGGASVLDIRPLSWKDGWPVAGENMKEGTYEIESAHGHGTRAGRGRSPGRRSARRQRWRIWRTRRTWRSPRRHRWTCCTKRTGSGRNQCARWSRPARWRIIRWHWFAGTAAGRCASFDELAYRRNWRAPCQLSASSATEMDGYSCRECRRVSRLSLLQNHGCRDRPRVGGDCQWRTGFRSELHRRRNNFGGWINSPTARGA